MDAEAHEYPSLRLIGGYFRLSERPIFSGMPSPGDSARHPSVTSAVIAEDLAPAPHGVTSRLPYSVILRELAALFGAQLAREHLAAARKASTDDGNG